ELHQRMFFFFSSRRRHTSFSRDWSSDVCSSDLGLFQKSEAADVKDAVDAASEAYKSWRLLPAPKRGEILFKVANRLLANKEKYRSEERRVGKERRSRRPRHQ